MTDFWIEDKVKLIKPTEYYDHSNNFRTMPVGSIGVVTGFAQNGRDVHVTFGNGIEIECENEALIKFSAFDPQSILQSVSVEAFKRKIHRTRTVDYSAHSEKQKFYEQWAMEKMAEHGLLAVGYKFIYNNSFGRGWCNPSRKIISIPRNMADRFPDEQVKDTILHEIAHGMKHIVCREQGIFNESSHGRLWKYICRQIGARPERTYDISQFPNVTQLRVMKMQRRRR